MLLFSRRLCLSCFVLCCLSTYAAAAPVALFDESHGQKFLINNNGPLDLSALATLIQSHGFTVKKSSTPLSKEVLAQADVLVISGPFRSLTENENTAVVDFIQAGGGVAILLHIAPPVRALLHSLDVDFSNGVLREASQVIEENPLNFKVTLLAKHPLIATLSSFSVYGAWALRSTAPHARAVAMTSKDSCVDLNYDSQLTAQDAVQSFAVMVAGEMGRGRYVVLGDDALFQNKFLDEANRQLALQSVAWLSGK